jgi:hypothetical protein
VNLSWISPDIELLALASALSATERLSLSTATIRENLRQSGPETLTEIARAALAGRGSHDEWPKEFAVGQIGFDLVLDFGAWRDLQRHRVGLQLRARPATELGYSIPDELLLPTLTWELDHYRRSMDRATEFHSRVYRANGPYDAEYLTALGHHTAWTAAMDLRQWAYLVELRSGPSGHQSYRDRSPTAWPARCFPTSPTWQGSSGWTGRGKPTAGPPRNASRPSWKPRGRTPDGPAGRPLFPPGRAQRRGLRKALHPRRRRTDPVHGRTVRQGQHRGEQVLPPSDTARSGSPDTSRR